MNAAYTLHEVGMTDRQRQVLEALRHSGFVVSEMVKGKVFDSAEPPFTMIEGAGLLANVLTGGKLEGAIRAALDESSALVENACQEVGWKVCRGASARDLHAPP